MSVDRELRDGRRAGVVPGPFGPIGLRRVGTAAWRSRRILAARRAASRPTAPACAISSSWLPSPAMPPVASTSSGRWRGKNLAARGS